jgi:fructose-1,6-bisphosphatase II / sedoheptulose-1,7-bisphosphatase
VVMRSKSGTVRYIEAHHNFRTKTSIFPEKK